MADRRASLGPDRLASWELLVACMQEPWAWEVVACRQASVLVGEGCEPRGLEACCQTRNMVGVVTNTIFFRILFHNQQHPEPKHSALPVLIFP